MKNKSLALIAFLVSLLALPACRQMEGPGQPMPATYRMIPVQVGQAEAEDGTRSLVSIEIEHFQKAALFALDPVSGTILTYGDNAGDLAGQPMALRTERQHFQWALPVQVPMDIYALVNYGSLNLDPFFNKNLKRSDLEALVFTSNGPSELRKLETSGQGLPMAGIKRQVTLSASGEGLTVQVRKLYAKYNLSFDLTRVREQGWHVQAMHMIVENANTEVPYFQEGFRQTDASKLMEYDRATESDLDMLQRGDNDHAVTLYMLENCQGKKEGAESWKTVCKDLGFEAIKNCTYIDLSVKVQRDNGEYQNLGYAIYLGKTDMRSDFDIQRNLFKTIKIVLPGPSDPVPASRFFRFSGTENPTVSPGETIDLYYVTNLDETDISGSCNPEGFLTPVHVAYETGEDGIATGYIRFQAADDLEEGAEGLVTGGSFSHDATDQKTVTASWPVILDTDTSHLPAYVAQQGYLQVFPASPVVRIEAAPKAGSEGILEVTGVVGSGSNLRVALNALSAGSGRLILRHFNSAGTETGSQEIVIPIQAPQLRFNADTYRLNPDGTVLTGTLSYVRKDGSAFSVQEKAAFSLPLIKRLLFPGSTIPFENGTPFAEASFTRTTEDDLQSLSLPLQLRLACYSASGMELDLNSGALLDRLHYEADASTGIAGATADVSVINPLEGLAGKCLGIIENNLPVYHAFQQHEDLLRPLGIGPEQALSISSYRNGSTFSSSGSKISLEVTLPVSISLPVEMDSPAEFSIACSGNRLTLTAREASRYEGFGRYALRGHIRHSESQERSPAIDMGYLEIYLTGAVAPTIRSSGSQFSVAGTLLPSGSASPLGELAQGKVTFGENTEFTEKAVREQGLYLFSSTASHNLYYSYEDVDENGITRYAKNGETAYLNSYRLAKGAWKPDIAFLDFSFGMIYLDNYHDHDLFTAAQECGRMARATLSGCDKKGNLYHFRDAADKDGSGYSYCALINLFAGEGFQRFDVFL